MPAYNIVYLLSLHHLFFKTFSFWLIAWTSRWFMQSNCG